MGRFVRFLLRNWPLKLAAVVLATLLYGGLVLAQNTRAWQGRIPITLLRPPAGAVVLEPVAPEVTALRYRAPVDVAARLTVDDFQASADLAGLRPQAGGPPEIVRVNIRALDSRVEIVDYEPKNVTVRLDPVVARTIPVTVDRGEAPPGLDIGPVAVQPPSITVRGASSAVIRVRQVVARVTIDASGLNVDSEVDVVPTDERGDVVPRVELSPERARVTIQVARQLATRPLPVVPSVVGTVGDGYRVAAVRVDPITVTVSGEEPVVARLQAVATDPVDVTGRTADFEATVALTPPPEITVVGADRVRIAVDVEADDGTRTFRAGLELDGARPDRTYTLAVGEVQVTLGGPLPALATVDATRLLTRVPVSTLAPGTHDVRVSLTPPAGTALVGISPPTVRVTVATASPAPESPAASAAPAG